jgi:hypothetical protein
MWAKSRDDCVFARQFVRETIEVTAGDVEMAKGFSVLVDKEYRT